MTDMLMTAKNVELQRSEDGLRVEADIYVDDEPVGALRLYPTEASGPPLDWMSAALVTMFDDQRFDEALDDQIESLMAGVELALRGEGQ